MPGLPKFRMKLRNPARRTSTIRAEMNSGATELQLGGDVAGNKNKDKIVKVNDDTKGKEIKKENGEKNEKGQKKTKGVKKETLETIPELQSNNLPNFDVNKIHKNSTMIVIASRRSGKSHLITHLLEEYSKKNKLDGVFLFSKTLAGFEGIPSSYRYRNLDILPSIIETQMKVKKHNLKAKPKEIVKSNIVLILDDMIGSGGRGQEMRVNPILNKLFVNGRHLSHKENSNILTILISQVYTAISPQIRLNTDYLFSAGLQSRFEREKIVNGFLSLNSGRTGLRESYEIFDSVVNHDNFNFIAINTTHQNKKKFSDYVSNFRAPAQLQNKKLTGNAEDWKYNKQEVVW